jgi:hypothetical protein
MQAANSLALGRPSPLFLPFRAERRPVYRDIHPEPGFFCFFFKSNFYTTADLRQGAVSRVLRLHEMFKVTTGANRARDAGCT